MHERSNQLLLACRDVHCARLAWRGKKWKQRKRAEGLLGDASVVQRWPTVARWFQRCRQCWWQLLCFFFFLSPYFSLLSSSSGLLFFFFFGLITLLPLLSLLSFPLSSLFCFFSPLLFSRALPCIYRKNRGERGRGRPLCNHPKNCPRNTSPPSSPTRGKLRASGVGQRLFKRELAVENRGRKKIFFFPCFARPGEEEDIWCRLKRHHFCFFFFSFFFAWTLDEMAPFFPKHAVSFKWELAPKMRQIQNQALNLSVFCILVLGLGFLQLSP